MASVGGCARAAPSLRFLWDGDDQTYRVQKSTIGFLSLKIFIECGLKDGGMKVVERGLGVELKS